jgi:hypothetical protein
MRVSIYLALLTLFVAWLVFNVSRLVYNIFLHPLSQFPGPLAAKATRWWKTYIEVVRQDSFTDVLIKLHKQYGEQLQRATSTSRSLTLHRRRHSRGSK